MWEVHFFYNRVKVPYRKQVKLVSLTARHKDLGLEGTPSKSSERKLKKYCQICPGLLVYTELCTSVEKKNTGR